jgi:HK97 family phage portal protein
VFSLFKKKQQSFDDNKWIRKYDPNTGSTTYAEETSSFEPADFINLYSYHWLIYSAITAKAERLSQIPIVIKDSKGISVTDPSHFLVRFFNRPNETQSWQEFLEATITFLETTGNALWELNRDNKGKIQKIYNLSPDKIDLIKDNKNSIVAYNYYPSTGNIYRLKTEDVIHHKYTSTSSELWGTSPLAPLIPSVLISIYLDLYIKNFFKNSGKVAGVLETDKDIPQPIFERIENRWQKLYQGLNNAWKTLILDRGLTYKPISIKPDEMPFGELNNEIILRILAVLDVAPIMIGSLKDASYANAKQQYRIFWEALLPKAQKITSKITHFLLPQMGYEGYSVEMDFSNIDALKEDAKLQAEIDSIYVRSHIKVPNEVRQERWGLEGLPGGDEMFVQVGTKVIETEKNIVKQEIRETTDRVGFEEWIEFYKITTKGEKQLAGIISDFFNKIKEDILSKTKDNYESKNIEGILSNGADYIKEIVTTTKLPMQKAIARGAKTAIAEIEKEISIQKRLSNNISKAIDIGYNFDLTDTEITNWLSKEQYKFADQTILETTFNMLRKELKEGFEQGETMKEISARVSKVFEGTVRATSFRAMLIARTEIISASNFGKSFSYNKMAVPYKQWIASYGAIIPPRPTHEIAHRQIVKQSELFIVGGEMANYPGDPGLSAKERCQCRCTIKGLLKHPNKK